MNFFKRSGHYLGLWLVMTLLSVGLPLAVIAHKVTDAETAKTWLREANTYERALEAGLSLTDREQSERGHDGQPQGPEGQPTPKPANGIDKQRIIDAIVKGYGPDNLQNQAESILDATYAWLNGETKELKFEVGLADRREGVAASLRAVLAEELAKLPVCTDVPPEGEDITQWHCLPAGTNSTQLADAYVQKLLYSEDNDLVNQKLNPEDFGYKVGAEPPAWWGLLQKVIPFLIIGVLLGSLLAIVGAPTIKGGIKRLGLTVAGASTFAIIGLLVFSKVDEFVLGFEDPSAAAGQTAMLKLLGDILRVASNDIVPYGLKLCATFLVGGVVMWVVARHLQKEETAHTPAPKKS